MKLFLLRITPHKTILITLPKSVSDLVKYVCTGSNVIPINTPTSIFIFRKITKHREVYDVCNLNN